MLRRAVLAPIVLFWLLMNALLWRSEFQGEGELAMRIPPAVIWEKILTAPDDSALDIFQSRKKVGYCRWMPNVGGERETGKVSSAAFDPEGQIDTVSGYTVDLEGSFLWEETDSRLRFSFHGSFNTNHTWQEIDLQVTVRPTVWRLQASAEQRKVTLESNDGQTKWRRSFDFEQFRDPTKLLGQLGLPALPGLSEMIPVPAAPQEPGAALGLTWEARHDWLSIGHSQVKVYRLQAELLGRFEIVLLLSRVGEILRVQLPSEIVLVNDALLSI